MKGPHQNQPVRVAGMDLSQARGAMVMLHGRGATAESILSLVPELGIPDFAYLAPQAGGNSWWPQSFLAPIPQNEPGISSAMQAVRGRTRSRGSRGRTGRPHRIAGFFPGCVPGRRIRRAQCTPVWRCRKPEWRFDRAERDTAGLRGLTRGNAGISRLQRRGLTHPG